MFSRSARDAPRWARITVTAATLSVLHHEHRKNRYQSDFYLNFFTTLGARPNVTATDAVTPPTTGAHPQLSALADSTYEEQLR